MMSQPAKQTIAINILSSISGSKSNQAVKLGQLIQYNKRNVFLFKSYAENEAGRLVPDLFLVFKYA